MNKFFIIFIATLFVIFGCNKNRNLYYSEFKSYLEKELKLTNNDNTIYFVLHLQGCRSCIQISLANLLQVNEKSKWHIIFVGNFLDENDKELKALINDTRKNYPSTLDSMQRIFNYQTNFGNPLLVHSVNNKCKIYQSIDTKRIESFFRRYKD